MVSKLEFITWNHLRCVANASVDCAKENIQCIEHFDGEDIIKVDKMNKDVLPLFLQTFFFIEV